MTQLNELVSENFMVIKPKYYHKIFLRAIDELKAKSKPASHYYRIGGKVIRANHYNEYFTQALHLALSHLQINPTNQVDLSVDFWDSKASGIFLTPPFESQEYYFPTDALVNKALGSGYKGVFLGGENSLNFFDQENKQGYFWVQDAQQIPNWIIGAPARMILHWFLSLNQIHLIHGAVVDLAGKGVLLTAKGGSGKSTTSLSCLLSGMNYLGDDYVGIEMGGQINAHSLYHSAKLEPNHLKNFPKLQDKIWEQKADPDEKAIVFLSDLFPGQIIPKTKLSAILIPVIKNIPQTQIVSAKKMQALLAIAPTTLFQLPLLNENKLSAMKAIISQTPCYFLELSPDIDSVPDVIKCFIKNIPKAQ